VLVHNIVLVITCSEDDGAPYRDSCPDEWGSGNVFVVHQNGVNTTECHIRSGQPFSIGFLVLYTIRVNGIAILEVACHLPFGLWVFGRYEFWRGRLHLAGSSLDGFLSTGVDSRGDWTG